MNIFDPEHIFWTFKENYVFSDLDQFNLNHLVLHGIKQHGLTIKSIMLVNQQKMFDK